jgi:prepilin-type N-terminal cleavage/methylation domain-containing protein
MMKKYSSTLVSNQRGFTLLEILIAITILAFITLAVVDITENAAQTMERTTEINKNNLQIETAMSRFEWDFTQIYSPLYFSTAMNLNQASGTDYSNLGNTDPTRAAVPAVPATPVNPQLQAYYENMLQRYQLNEHFSGVSKDGIPIPRFYSPEKNVFEFFTTSNRRKMQNSKQSHFGWVRYSLMDKKEEIGAEENPLIPKSLKNFVRYFTADDPYDDKRINVEDGKVKAGILLENVESLEFQFWNPNRKAWETNIKTVPAGENALRGVQISLVWYDTQGIKRTTVRVFRTLWPMSVVNDPAPTAAPSTVPTGGAAGGVAAGVNAGAGGGIPTPRPTGGF